MWHQHSVKFWWKYSFHTGPHSLVRGGLQTRLRSVRTGFLDIGWRDALTIYSVALPVMVMCYQVAHDWFRFTLPAWAEVMTSNPVPVLVMPAASPVISGLDRDRGNHSDWNSPHDPGTSRAGADLAPGRPGLPMDGVGHRGGKRPE